MPRVHRRAGGSAWCWGRALLGVAVSVAVAGALAGCGVGAQSAPQPLSPSSASYEQLGAGPSTSTSVPGLATARVTIYLEGNNQRLVPVLRHVAWPATMPSIMAQLAAGPSAGESDRGLGSPASSVGPFAVGPVRDGVVTVGLPASFENLSGQDQTVAAAQIVFTATTFSGVDGVRFLVGGQAAQVPAGNGSLRPGPSTRRDYSGMAS